MSSEPTEPRPDRPSPPIADLEKVLADLSNDHLLAACDLVLVELEKRLFHYARIGGELLEMANEGLVLSVKAGARLRQAVSSTSHTTSHLQLVGVGDWSPMSTRAAWNDDPRIAAEAEHDDDQEE
jgi:hypothetical protein